MDEVRRVIEQMKAAYKQKIEVLEQGLKAAEQKDETAVDTAETAKQASAASTAKRERSSIGAMTSGTYSTAMRGAVRLSRAADRQTSSAH